MSFEKVFPQLFGSRLLISFKRADSSFLFMGQSFFQLSKLSLPGGFA